MWHEMEDNFFETITSFMQVIVVISTLIYNEYVVYKNMRILLFKSNPGVFRVY